MSSNILLLFQYTSKNKKMVIFLATQDSVEFHARLLAVLEDEQTLELFKLHGDMPQKVRHHDGSGVTWFLKACHTHFRSGCGSGSFAESK